MRRDPAVQIITPITMLKTVRNRKLRKPLPLSIEPGALVSMMSV
jgi:hypothetical protein